MSSTIPQTNPRILVFDSGVGGLSIARAIRLFHQNIDILYVSDNAAFPYGDKDASVLIERSIAVIGEAIRQHPADMIVIGCNTASTIVLPALRKIFKTPIIGVVPAIKPAAQLSQSKVIGLLATPGTIERHYTRDLIQEFAADCEIVSIGSTDLVKIAEDKLHGVTVKPIIVHKILAPFKKIDVMDTVILACTHFPLVLTELKKALPHVQHWVDSGEAIARRVDYWLAQLNLQNHVIMDNYHECMVTEKTPALAQLTQPLEQEGFSRITNLDLPYKPT